MQEQYVVVCGEKERLREEVELISKERSEMKKEIKKASKEGCPGTFQCRLLYIGQRKVS